MGDARLGVCTGFRKAFASLDASHQLLEMLVFKSHKMLSSTKEREDPESTWKLFLCEKCKIQDPRRMMHHNVHLVLRSRVQSPKFSKLDAGQQTESQRPECAGKALLETNGQCQ